MRFAADFDQHPTPQMSIRRIAESLRIQLQQAQADLTVLFVTPAHAEHFEEIVQIFADEFPTRNLLGCTAESVVGRDREIEGGRAISAWAASLPGVTIDTFHAHYEPTPDGVLWDGLPVPEDQPADARAILMLADPFTCPPRQLINRLAEDLPGLPLLGGMASGVQSPGEHRLVRNNEVMNFGGVGAVLSGPLRIRTVVSQGCQPIGRPFVVTRSDHNVIFELGGVPALQRLRETFSVLDDQQRALFQRGPHIGIAINEYKDHFGRGDFLVSNIIGADEEGESITVGSLVRIGQTIQFHTRDADSAHEDLKAMLGDVAAPAAGANRGALLFTCNGRGTRMFDAPHHDAALVQSTIGPIPLAGLFAAGELGPVGDTNHVHGFTASLAIFEPETPDTTPSVVEEDAPSA